MKLSINKLFLIFFLMSFLSVAQGQNDADSTETEDPIEKELGDLNLEEKNKAPKKTLEDPVKFFDMGTYSTQKAFKSSKVQRYSLWEKIENDCGLSLDQIPIELTSSFEDISRVSQSSLFDLIKGNVKLSNQIISPTERQFMHSPFLTPGSSSRIFGCLTGMTYREENFILNNVNYFGLVLANIAYLKEELQYKYHKNGRSHYCDIIRNKSDIDKVLADPTRVGIILSIGGGHSLGNYLYIEQGQVATEEYKNIVLNNIRQLKGVVPISTDPEEYLDIPIFSLSFGNYFDDGVSGKTSRFTLAEEEAFKRPTTIDDDITPLGQAVVQELLKNEGRKILVDIGGMSLRAREWYYKFVKDERFKKDTFPIIVTGVGISGLSKKESTYGRDDKRELLNHLTYNLCRQDLLSIVESEGLIGITLDKNKLMGGGFLSRYNNAVPHSAERHYIAIDAIVGNICKAIHMSNSIQTWDMITISSEFDSHSRHFDAYDSSSKMVNLYRDLLEFFKNPRDIEGLYTAKEIANFMYSFTAEEIVDKIMYKNALAFTKKHLQEVKK